MNASLDRFAAEPNTMATPAALIAADPTTHLPTPAALITADSNTTATPTALACRILPYQAADEVR
ncbi:hypothetical protein Ani05nite_53340 [Amorphoplanes nipponensis]|uniref:Uncharacterized protein n=1 Tax=Actinoplanes nipponensis TaxID=135950 RepID=A0A919MW34_9ACTN|nr:hypothetical protein Ani05nite_53340 [Actinoplanes nipponensis]